MEALYLEASSLCSQVHMGLAALERTNDVSQANQCEQAIQADLRQAGHSYKVFYC